jgi:hypothetical protein
LKSGNIFVAQFEKKTNSMETFERIFLVAAAFGLILLGKFLFEVLPDLFSKKKSKAQKINTTDERIITQTATTMSNKIEAYLQSKEIRFSITEDTDTRTIFRFRMSLETGNFDVNIYDLKERNIVFMQIVSLIKIPENKRAQAAEYFIRINDGRLMGSFEIDYDEGDFRYRSSFFYDENETDFGMQLTRNYYAIINSMDDYFAGLMKVIYSNESPVDVLHEINNQPNPILN